MSLIGQTHEKLHAIADAVAERLIKLQTRVVFAESCTSGLIAATLSRYPGVSDVLCGSCVTYRNATKQQWLGVDGNALDDPNVGPVSQIVSEQMARGVLSRTPEAEIAVSITGHLGPNAPEKLDGIAYSTICFRSDRDALTRQLQLDGETEIHLEKRYFRQLSAAQQVLLFLNEELDSYAK
ncbi:Nicotinamide-nucleotide amidohydrolase PncC [Thalassoglobus neptunius]|uniref:Nicotinamide-nucleotide amidohydrolase PncC n=1 Tax=Thalassoglobus neptunius TaxID=1938619 RepID=A0A5C5X1B8_9PLAN|nr:Nicotinamide-nucleotide amidohydrolase PncC [Thalassoglobus neptunius]